jgi:DNA repair protein RadC
MDSPDAMADLLGPEMRALSKESLRVVLITTRLTLLRVEEVHLGSVNEVSAHVRDVLRPVITSDAFGFSVVHNHPSGNPEPSSADRVFTRKLKEVAELMQCRFLDHIIIGQASEYAPKGYFSFREHGMLS